MFYKSVTVLRVEGPRFYVSCMEAAALRRAAGCLQHSHAEDQCHGSGGAYSGIPGLVKKKNVTKHLLHCKKHLVMSNRVFH